MPSQHPQTWFPIEFVDEAVGTSHGSGRSEKAVMTWFAARPVAQARAAVLGAVLDTTDERTRRLIETAITGNPAKGETFSFDDAVKELRAKIEQSYPDGLVLLDPFSGRGMIPLEAARFGVASIGTDLAPLAVFASRLLAEYPFGDWSDVPALPEDWANTSSEGDILFAEPDEHRLLSDVGRFLAEAGDRLRQRCEPLFPKNPDGTFPWGYLWAVTIPCDGCGRRFPLIGSLALRHPRTDKNDLGQWLRLRISGNEVIPEVEAGTPDQEPTFASVAGQQGRVARCPFPCGHVHSLDTIKQKGFEGEFQDRVLLAAENNSGDGPSKVFRTLRSEEIEAANSAPQVKLEPIHGLSAIPDERIPDGNNDTVRASGYGYASYGALMVRRQAIQFVVTCEVIEELREEASAYGVPAKYANVLASYAGATLVRRIKYATRGAQLRAHKPSSSSPSNTVQVDHIYADESKVSDGFDFFEAGIGEGPGTWASIASSEISALKKASSWPTSGTPGKFRPASATALPLRDGTVDLVVTDPPYYNMIDYSDASDLLYVWARRALYGVQPDLFGKKATDLQPKDDEIIVKRGGPATEHRTKDFYHRRLADSFREIRRVLKPGGTLSVIFGHHDPDAWIRLLTALQEAGFVVVAAWPSRTESAKTGVASVKITITIVCRVAADNRPTGLVADVDREVRAAVEKRAAEWNDQGLAQPDQNMASYGPAMEAFGAYSKVVFPNGEPVDIERYLLLARRVVREQLSLPVETLPLDVFDAPTRLALYWLRFYGTSPLAKGESRYVAQTEGVRLEDVRSLFSESKKGFTLTLKPTPLTVSRQTPLFSLMLGMAAAHKEGGSEAVADLIAEAVEVGVLESPTDARLWAITSYIPNQIPRSSELAKALASLQRSQNQLIALSHQQRTVRSDRGDQQTLGLEEPR